MSKFLGCFFAGAAGFILGGLITLFIALVLLNLLGTERRQEQVGWVLKPNNILKNK